MTADKNAPATSDERCPRCKREVCRVCDHPHCSCEAEGVPDYQREHVDEIADLRAQLAAARSHCDEHRQRADRWHGLALTLASAIDRMLDVEERLDQAERDALHMVLS